MADRAVFPLPVRIEEIDRAWLTAALRTRSPDVRVHDFAVADINRGTCTKIRLRLDMNEAGRQAGIPETVILKGGFEPHSRDMGYMHESEVRSYRDVLHHSVLHGPACYFADYDVERRQGIIIMEDLVARGVSFCDPLRPQTLEQVARRLTILARHHAVTWDSPELEPGGALHWAPLVLDNFRHYATSLLKPETWRRFVASPRGAAASVRFHSLDWMIDALDRLYTLGSQLPHVLIHGDTHLGNLYIDTDGTPGFFDSLPHRSPAIYEVAYHITCALDPSDRRRWEESLVHHYLDELGRSGANPPSFEEAMRQYGAFLALGYCVFLINDSLFQSESVNTAYTARFSAAMIDRDTIGLLRTIQ